MADEPKIIDVDYEWADTPPVQMMPVRRRAGLLPRQIVGWTFGLLIVAFGLWDIISDGYPTLAIHRLLFGS